MIHYTDENDKKLKRIGHTLSRVGEMYYISYIFILISIASMIYYQQFSSTVFVLMIFTIILKLLVIYLFNMFVENCYDPTEKYGKGQ